MILDTLLALGLVLSELAQLRPSIAPLGPGEWCLLIWCALMLARALFPKVALQMTPALPKLLIFWLLFTLAQSLGTLTGMAIRDEHDTQSFVHDSLAYVLAAGVSCLSVIHSDPWHRAGRVAWMVSLIGGAVFALQLANAHALFQIPRIHLWMWDQTEGTVRLWDRFQGWSANPNQLAILASVLLFLALFHAETAAGPAKRIIALGCLSLSAYVGLLTKSNTFTIVLVAAGPVFAALKSRTWLLSLKNSAFLPSAFACLLILAVPFTLAAFSTTPLGSALSIKLGDLGRDKVQGTADEAALRIYLWHRAIGRGIESGLLGLGPGPHSELPRSFDPGQQGGQDGVSSKSKPWSNFEAHNTLLELFTQGGLIAVLSSIWLMMTAAWAARKAKLGSLIVLLSGFVIFSMFHVIVRHPIVWFALALCLAADTQPASRAGSGAGAKKCAA